MYPIMLFTRKEIISGVEMRIMRLYFDCRKTSIFLGITNVKLHRSIVKTWKIYANWCWFWQTFSYHFQLLQILISRNGILFMGFTLYAMFLVLRRICNTHSLRVVDSNLKKSSWHGLNHFKNHCISYTCATTSAKNYKCWIHSRENLWL